MNKRTKKQLRKISNNKIKQQRSVEVNNYRYELRAKNNNTFLIRFKAIRNLTSKTLYKLFWNGSWKKEFFIREPFQYHRHEYGAYIRRLCDEGIIERLSEICKEEA